MKINTRHLASEPGLLLPKILTPLLLIPLLLGGIPAHATLHVASIPNKTGKTANDLHVKFGHPTADPRCDQLTNTQASTDGGYSYTFDTGNVPSSSSATIRWNSKFSPEQIQEGYWTWNGTNIGNFDETTVALNYTNNPDGSALVTFVNMGTNPVVYTNLRVYTGANQAFFNTADFLDQMNTGQPVETRASNGTAPPGTTVLTEFRPSLTGYTAISVLVNGGLFALGSSPAAELESPLKFGSQVLIPFSGDLGRVYALESSTDFRNWTAVDTNPVTSTSATLVDPSSGGASFYRALLLAPTNAPPTNGPCPGGVFVGGYTISECISGFWHVVYYDTYACPPDWQRQTYRVKLVSTGQPCQAALDESLLTGAPNATAVRNVTFGTDGAIFSSSSSALDYSASWFPAEGTIELDLSTRSSGGWILDTRGIGFRLPGDAVMTVDSSGKAFFAIDPVGGQNPGTLPGVTTTSVINDGLFHTVSVSYGSGGLKIYVDGTLENSNPELAIPLVRSTITLGDYLDALPQSFVGSIRHLRTSAIQADVQQPRNIVQGPFIFANTTGLTVNDFHAVFSGTGGTLNNPRMTAGPPDAVISARGNQVDIVFPTPIAPGTTIGFTVQSRFTPITFQYGWWTIDGEPAGPAVPSR